MREAEISVEYIEHMGGDLSVVNAARVSFAKAHDRLEENDHKLIDYLSRENHFMPFCHPHLSLRIKAPIFVARQLVKHQIGGSWSEESRRYVDDEPEFFVPKSWRERPRSNIKQGSGFDVDMESQRDCYAIFDEAIENAVSSYLTLLSLRVAPEQARMVLPLNVMTQWVWTGSLQFFARVCNLRLDSHAQAETREVAQQISAIAGKLFPVSWSVLVKEVG